MRNLVRAVVVLVVLASAYWGWALVGAAQLASAASQSDPEAMMRRIDLPALKRSLSSQVAHAYLEQNPQFRKLSLLEQNFLGSASAGAANELLSGMLTPDNIAALLAKGRVGPSAGRTGIDWRTPPLSEAFRAGPLHVLWNTYFDGPVSFVVGIESAEGRYDVRLRLSGTTWRLSGLDVPEEVSARLARAIAEKVGGLNDSR
jgi:hypothetical protein